MDLVRFRIVHSATLTLLLLAGCTTTPPSEFYMLAPMPVPTQETDGSSAARPLSLGVGPIRLPDYLDAPQVITRPTPNRLTMHEFHRWGGSLAGNLIPVLAQNLSVELGTDNVAMHPWNDPVDPDYRIRLEMLRFDGNLGGSVELDTRWELVGRDPRDAYSVVLLGAGRITISEPVEDASYEALVAAQSRAVAKLSQQLADKVRQVAGA